MKKILLCFLMILALSITLLIPVLTVSAAEDTLRPVAAFVSGESYVLSIGGINDVKGAFGDACVMGEEAEGYGLDYAKRPDTLSAASKYLWKITQNADGTVTLYSAYAKKYLNMKKDVAYLDAAPQNLNAEISGGKIKIYTKIDGETYYLRFTNLYKTYSCWHAGTGTSSNQFTMYGTAEMSKPKEYDNTGKTPLFSVACFADLHVDYGIQSWTKPIRKTTVDAVNKLKALGGANVILIGGDILSNNSNDYWDNTLAAKAQKTVYETMMDGSTDWLVLPVTGNHDSEAGVAAGSSEYSGDWEPYLTEWVGDFVAVQRNENSKFKEILCYRYTLGGIDFIGINTPYLANRGSGLLTSQADWLEDQLEEIGKDKTVVVTSHYPVLHAQYPVTSLDNRDARAAFETVLNKYPNVLYCYGHVHHNDSEYAWYSAAELIRPTGNTTLNSDNSYTTNGFINCHMGSMGYYNNQYQPGGLLAVEPQVVQFMKMDFYEDHITFNYYNVGEKSGDPQVYEITSYTVKRDMAEQLGAADSGNTDVSTETESDSAVTDTQTGTVTDSATGTNPATETVSPDTVTDTASDESNIALVILIAAIAAAVLLGGAVVLILVLKKK